MARKTKQESLKTYELIVDTAEQLFSSKGFSQTTLHDIAQQAQMTRGAIYWHFKDKAELLDAILERAQLPWDGLPQRPDEIETPLSTTELAKFLVHCIETIIKDPRLYRVSQILLQTTELVDGNHRIHVRLTCILERIRIYIAAMLSRGHGSGSGTPCTRVERAASSVKTMLTGVIYESLINPDYIELSHLTAVLEQALLLGGPDPAQCAPRR
ncbi:TetR family transcriptional regulator [Pseudomonas sp. X10]